MNLRKILYIVIGLFSTTAFGQHANRDVFRQFSSEENIYNLVNTEYYQFFHKHYVNEEALVLQSKTSQNAFFQAYLAKEKVYADSIDSAFTARNKIELKRVADRKIDLTYETDAGSILTALEKWNKDINKIVFYGGSSADRKVWLNRYNCVKQAIEVASSGNEPSGSKHTYYLSIINEIKDWHTRLKVYLMSLVCGRDLRKDYEKIHSEELTMFNRKSTLINCLASRVMRINEYAKTKTIKK